MRNTSKQYLGKTKGLLGILSIAVLGSTALLPSQAIAQASIAEREAKAKRINTLYNMAEKAYRDGDIQVARDTLRSVLAENPRHAHSIALLRKIKLNGPQLEINKKRRQFNAVKLKQIDYNGVSLAQALKILNQQVMQASNEKVIPNFVLSDPKKYLGDEKLDLKLSNVPAGVVLDHLMKKAGTSAVFGKYSITVRPKPSVHRKKAKPAPAPKEDEE